MSRNSPGVIAFTVAWVPTGIKTGVSTLACGRESLPVLALHPGSLEAWDTENANGSHNSGCACASSRTVFIGSDYITGRLRRRDSDSDSVSEGVGSRG